MSVWSTTHGSRNGDYWEQHLFASRLTSGELSERCTRCSVLTEATRYTPGLEPEQVEEGEEGGEPIP